jgi:hypothetical protein
VALRQKPVLWPTPEFWLKSRRFRLAEVINLPWAVRVEKKGSWNKVLSSLGIVARDMAPDQGSITVGAFESQAGARQRLIVERFARASGQGLMGNWRTAKTRMPKRPSRSKNEIHR